MRKLFYFILITSLTFGQNSNTIQIDWKGLSEVEYGTNKYTLPLFSYDNFLFNPEVSSISYVKKIDVDRWINEKSLIISNIEYTPVATEELTAIQSLKIPSEIQAKIENESARGSIKGLMTFSPIFKKDGVFYKVTALTYAFTYDTSSSKNTQTATSYNSIVNASLSTGNWFRFYVEKSGIYKLSKSFIQSLGLDLNGVNPKKIKIFGNGGRMVPLSNNSDYPIDNEENAIQVKGEDDGVFNDTDYVLFYAEGVDTYNTESDTHLNLYSDKSYYFITTDGGNGKRIDEFIQPTGNSTSTITTSDEYQFHEVDLYNIVKTGRRWYGETFAVDNEQEFEFKCPDISNPSQAKLKVHLASASFNLTEFTIKSNEQTIGTLNFPALTANSGTEAIDLSLTTSITPSETTKIKITFDNNGVPSSKGYLDYITLEYKRKLIGTNSQFKFQHNDAATSFGIGEYQFTNATTIKEIWNITDLFNVSKISNSTASSSFNFKTNLGELQKFITLVESDFFTPKKEQQTRVANQNLKGTLFKDNQNNFKDIDYLIITPNSFVSQAEKLATFHRNYSQLNVKVVTLESIYQEFSSGKQDIGGIRNLVRYVYENASDFSKKVKYLNLFGDASFDFKNRTVGNTNYVPIFHTLNSNTTGESSFASDDFFACMDSFEGNVELTSNAADIAVGRMIVSSTQQAEEMVNKVVEYHDIKSYGSWRNDYVAVSDDPDLYKTQDKYLQLYQNNLTDVIHAQKPFLNYKKILLDSYQQVSSAGGDRYPKAREEMFNSFEKGALVFNYLGHGGEDGLTGERIWEKSDGENFSNQYRYPLFITITCDFSRFDNPLRPTAGEYTYWNPKGGAISMITTIRSIGQGSAQIFNNTLAEKIFSYGNTNYVSIAESLRQAKFANNNNSSTRVVFYLGDPALMLAIPKPQIILTKVNDAPLSGPIDDFKALSYMKLSGQIQDENGTLLPNYNGELAVNIFDKEYTKNTYRNDGADAVIDFNNTTASTLPFTVMGETLFRGNASITNGQFEFGFVVPKDIKIPVGNGKVSFYSKRNQVLLDKTGYNTTIKVGGINTNAPTDTTAPTVRLYMNDETFINGGITNESPYFLAFINDENGINTASGIGHDMIAILDGDDSNAFIVNDYFETELNDYTKGKIRFPFRNLSPGLHTITFKAWDVYNNFVTAEIQFLVINDDEMALTNVLNYPNPFVSYTEFWFTHNKPFEPLNVQVQIMTITGKIVKTINQTITTEGFLSRDIIWDGKDDFGDKIGKGTYIYKLTVQSTLTSKKSEKIEKLVIL